MAAYYNKRMIPRSLLTDDKSNTNFSSSESLDLGKNNIYLFITKQNEIKKLLKNYT